MRVVLDTSALLALLWDEPGSDRVAAVIGDARVSAVNLTELVGKLIDRGATDDDAMDVIETLALDVVPFDSDQAMLAGTLSRATRSAGLSLGDRACLALALHEGRSAMTADRSWSRLELDLEIAQIR